MVSPWLLHTCMHSEPCLSSRTAPLPSKAGRQLQTSPPFLAEQPHLVAVWGTGQDQMRLVKTRLLQMMPDACVFLDVDDLKTGKGAEYVDASQLTLVFVSDGYFASPNCMRELLRAVVRDKPITAMMEPEKKHGGLTSKEVATQLLEADGYYEQWGLAREVTAWGHRLPAAGQIYHALFKKPPLEWNRLSAFQDVTLRLLAERFVLSASPKYLSSDLTYKPVPLPLPLFEGGQWHLYASPHNVGAAEFVAELNAFADRCKHVLLTKSASSSMLTGRKVSLVGVRSLGNKRESLGAQLARLSAPSALRELPPHPDIVQCTMDARELPRAARMLVYLNARTWTSLVAAGNTGIAPSAALADDIRAALARQVGAALHAMRMPCAGTHHVLVLTDSKQETSRI